METGVGQMEGENVVGSEVYYGVSESFTSAIERKSLHRHTLQVLCFHQHWGNTLHQQKHYDSLKSQMMDSIL